jgi:hypothetical protein
MSEDEARILKTDEDQDEVEAHRRGNSMGVNEEPAEEYRKEDDDDDFEAHRRHSTV